MPRRLIVIALLLSMLTQACAFGSSLAGEGGGKAALHSLLHWAGLGHHHRVRAPAPPDAEDSAASNTVGSLRVTAVADIGSDTCNQDQSPESTRHVLMDGFVSSAALIPSWPESVPARPPRLTPTCSDTERVPATPFLEGLRRPPRPTA